jgi:hypothetical protein
MRPPPSMLMQMMVRMPRSVLVYMPMDMGEMGAV